MNWTTYIGRVAINNPKDKLTIEVYCPDLTPFAQTELLPEHSLVTIPDENELPITVKVSNLVRCIWKGQSNWYPPDVALGEQVLVEVDETTQTYYWSILGRDNRLRYRESVRLYCVNKDNLQDKLDDSHTYFFEMNSLDDGKYVILQTNRTNKATSTLVEPYVYQFKIDTKSGTVLLTDDEGNTFYLESQQHRITLRNADQSQLILHKKDIYLNAEQSITLQASTINCICDNLVRSISENEDTTVEGNRITEIIGNDTESISGNTIYTVNGTQTTTVAGAVTMTTTTNFTINSLNETHSTQNVLNLTASKIISDRVAQTVGGPALRLN